MKLPCVFSWRMKRVAGEAWSTIARRVVSINQAHKAAGYPDSPASRRNPLVAATLKGIRRTAAAPKTKEPLLADAVRALVAACPGNLLGLRDRALCLVGWAAGLRCDSMSMLEVADIAERANGIGVMLRKSKTDQEGIGRVVPIEFGLHEKTCAVLALRDWLSASGIDHGFSVPWSEPLGPLVLPGRSDAGLDQPNHPQSGRTGRTSESVGFRWPVSEVRPGYAGSDQPIYLFEVMEITGHKSLAVLRLYARLGYLSRGVSTHELGPQSAAEEDNIAFSSLMPPPPNAGRIAVSRLPRC